MTKNDFLEYKASGRLEPNLHIFTNELYPCHESELDISLQQSWRSFLTAARSIDPQACYLDNLAPGVITANAGIQAS